MRSERTELHGADGQRLEARIDAPDAHIAAHAPFAHMSVINVFIDQAKARSDWLPTFKVRLPNDGGCTDRSLSCFSMADRSTLKLGVRQPSSNSHLPATLATQPPNGQRLHSSAANSNCRPQADIDLPRLDAARLTLNVKSSGRKQPPPKAEIQQVRSTVQG